MATVDQPTVVLGTEQSTCEHCGSPLAGDQRYCVVCGTRRGPSTLPDAMRGSSPQRPRRGGPPPKSSGGTSPAVTILAFIGALLLAMGVGILIGRSTNSASKPQTVHLTVDGGTGSSGSTAAQGTSATPPATSATQSATATSSAAATSSHAPAATGGTAKSATATVTHSTASSSTASKGSNGIFFGPGS